MMFSHALELLLLQEGGYVNNSADPGGETKYGISKRSYPLVDIAGLTKSQAADIYAKDFWNPLDLDRFPAIVRYSIFDFAVNSGKQTAIRKLQLCVNAADDGQVGPVTLAAVESLMPLDLLFKYNKERLKFMSQLKHWPTFKNGWMTRVFDITMESVKDEFIKPA
jgi:lysozyme family protein